MTRIASAVILAVLATCPATRSAAAQGVSLPKDVTDKLQQPQQPQAESRKMTTVPNPQSPPTGPAAGGSPDGGADADRLRSIRDLLEQVERKRGAQSGTIRAVGQGAGIALQHDLAKVRQNYLAVTDAPFGELLSDFANTNVPTANTPADVEYRDINDHDVVEKVVSIRSRSSIAANAFRSAETPVSLKVDNAGLSADQVPGDAEQLPVRVRVGDESRQLTVGEKSRFGRFEVTVLASMNRSKKAGREGLPYVLRLQVIPVQ